MDIKSVADSIVDELEKDNARKAEYKANPTAFIAECLGNAAMESDIQKVADAVHNQIQMKTIGRNARTALDIIRRAKSNSSS